MTDLDKVPVPGGGTGVNQPDSPYGQVADLNALKKQFPLAGGPSGPLGPPGGQPPAPVEMPVPDAGNPNAGMPGREQSPVPGLPRGLFRETEHPMSPIQGQLPPELPAAAAGPNPAHLQFFEALRQSSDPEAVEWAEMMLELMGEGG